MPKKITGAASSQPSAAGPAPLPDAGENAVEKKASPSNAASKKRVWEYIKKQSGGPSPGKRTVNEHPTKL